jgi:hypothetical protein
VLAALTRSAGPPATQAMAVTAGRRGARVRRRVESCILGVGCGEALVVVIVIERCLLGVFGGRILYSKKDEMV